MLYPELVALIDSQIARLRYARELLSTTALPDSLTPEAILAEPAVELDTTAVVPDAQDAGSQPQRQVRQVSPRLRRERRYVAKTRPVEQSALRSEVPAGPVFVPATRVVAQEPEVPAADGFAGSGEMPTAAQLTQRWLRAHP